MNWKKTITTIVVGGFLFFLLKKPLEALITSTIVENVFDKIQIDAWTNWAFFVLIILLVILWGFKIWKRFIPSLKFTLVLTVVTVVYSCYRWIDSVWIWIGLNGWEGVYYADIFYVLLFGQVVLFLNAFFRSEKFLKWWKKQLVLFKLLMTDNEQTVYEGFFCDEPVEDESDDILDFKKYAERLAKRILKSNSKRSFAIGINAKWGQGKTSFMTFLKKNLGDDIIEVNFDPWNSQNPQSIIADFFENFDQSLSPYNGSISRKLNRYARRLSGKDFNSFVSTIIEGVKSFSDIETIDDIRKSIQKDLKKIDKRIVVFIDDLDRLDQKEIIEVIRLIRNTADFQKTVFVVAYDREYIIQAIKGINEHDSRRFLEKIFQHEINLPYYDKSVLREHLYELIQRCVIDETEKENIREIIIGNVHSHPDYLEEWLMNLRDVSRLANSVLSNYFDVEDELVFSELLRLELIRIKYPFLYVRLISETDTYFEQGTSSYNSSPVLKLKKANKPRSHDSNNDTILNKFLLDKQDKYQLGIPEIERIMALLNGIFPVEKIFPSMMYTGHLSIRNPRRFHLYFSYGLLRGRLPEGEFKLALNAGNTEFLSALDKFVENGLELPLIKRISEMNKFQNRQEFERIIQGIFHLTTLDSKRAEYTAHTKVGYPSNDLFNKLIMGNKTVKLLYKTKDYYKTFLKAQLDQAEEPYTFEADFVNYAREHGWQEFILSESELFNYSKVYLARYLESVDKFDSNVWWLLQDSVLYRKEDVSGGGYRKIPYYNNEIRDLMKAFIAAKAIDNFIFAIIDCNMRDMKTYTISKVVLDIFNDWEDLKDFMNEHKSDGDNVTEFLEFYEACKEVNFGQYIPFEFKVIQVEDKYKGE